MQKERKKKKNKKIRKISLHNFALKNSMRGWWEVGDFFHMHDDGDDEYLHHNNK